MKKIVSLMFACLTMTLSAQTVKEVNEGIRYCESTYPFQDGLLIANFGTEELNPLNSEGKGYIVFYKDGKSEVLIPADGNLSAPKGMFVRNDYLYICDVNKIVVYNLADKKQAPQVLSLPEGNLFVNDLATDSHNHLYVSVTNTNKIFRLDISDPARPSQPEEWLNISGPNGILIHEDKMYVASYPADGVTKAENVIYRVEHLDNPSIQKLTQIQGQYDGIALAADGKSLYVSNWTPAQISRIDLSDGDLSPLSVDLPENLIGPADMSVKDGWMYIPDLPNSRVLILKEPSCCK